MDSTRRSDQLKEKSSEEEGKEKDLREIDEEAEDKSSEKLTDEDRLEIENEIKKNQPFIESALREVPVNVKGVQLAVIVSIIYIILVVVINQVTSTYNLGVIVRDSYENRTWQASPPKYFEDITTLNDVNLYIRRVAIPLCYTVIGDYNYLLGMRVTVKKSKVIKDPVDSFSQAQQYIEENPNMPPGIDNPAENKARQGILTYEKGYNNAGGYVLYFFPNQTLEESLKT